MPEAIIVLCGTKCDMRENASEKISKEDGEALKNEIGAQYFIECSAKQMMNINELFESSVKVVLDDMSAKLPKNKKCILQ